MPENAPLGLCPKCVLEGAETLASEERPTGGSNRIPKVEEIAPYFPELEILEMIGAGGMGAVYKARQLKLDRVVALKILSHDLGEDPSFVERFNREGRVLARLSHPNIVTVFDTGTAGPYAFLLMEFVDGVNLRQAMQAGGFTPAEALNLVQDVCAALNFAHEKGILHRDIKPENVLIDSSGQVKIADFGIAKILGVDDQNDVTLTNAGSILGSPQYMAPEQIESPGDVDQRADIYSLGVVLYEMLTGELPLGRFSLPSEKTKLDARIDEIVLRTLEKERELRYQNVSEIRTEVEALEDTPAPSQRHFFNEQIRAWGQITFWIMMMILLYLLFVSFSGSTDDDELLERSGRLPYIAGAAILVGAISVLLSGIHKIRTDRKLFQAWGGTLIVVLIVVELLFFGPLLYFTFSLAKSGNVTTGSEGLRPASGSEDGRLEREGSLVSIVEDKMFSDAEDHKIFDLDLKVASNLMAIFEFVETDAVGKEEICDDSGQGFVFASDKDPWQGKVRYSVDKEGGDQTSPPDGYHETWLMVRTEDSREDYVDREDLLNRNRSSLIDDAWKWEQHDQLSLELNEPGSSLIKLAYREDESKTLSLRVSAGLREVPGIPRGALSHVRLEEAVYGLGWENEWVRRLIEEIERSEAGVTALRTHTEPEPTWLEGRPEKHANITIPAGMVATVELEGQEVYQRAYIVASDLEPWVGKFRIGTLKEGSRMQWRIEGPLNTIKVEFEKPSTWILEPDAYTNTLDETTRSYYTRLGKIRLDDLPDDDLALRMKVQRRGYKSEGAGLPEFLPLPIMELGEELDWIEGVKEAIGGTTQP